MISVDGKSAVMRRDALRPASANAAAATALKPAARLSKGEKRNRKRLAEVGAVYHLTPLPCTAADILPTKQHDTTRRAPKAYDKWLTASLAADAAAVEGIEAIVFRTVGDQVSLWEAVLPPELLKLPDELARVDALLDDPAFFAPFVPFFDPRMGAAVHADGDLPAVDVFEVSAPAGL